MEIISRCLYYKYGDWL